MSQTHSKSNIHTVTPPSSNAFGRFEVLQRSQTHSKSNLRPDPQVGFNLHQQTRGDLMKHRQATGAKTCHRVSSQGVRLSFRKTCHHDGRLQVSVQVSDRRHTDKPKEEK